MPKLFIIQATGYRYRENRVPNKIRKRKMVGAVLPYLAALVPKGWEVTLVDDAVEEIDYQAPVDAVAITLRTVTSFRAYDIADKFRERKVPVLLGGPHATFHSVEMAEHADAVCIGEAEGVFPQMLEDAAAGHLKKFYRRDHAASMADMPTPRWDLLNKKHYVFYKPYVIQYSRSCPYVCDFCAERRLNGDYGYRYRPAEEVVEEVKKCGSRHIFFAASQFAGDKTKTMEFMEALIPLKVRWSALFSSRFCLDQEYMDLAKRSGLLHVNMGIESISQKTLKSMRKNINQAHEYKEVVRNLHQRDISYSFNMVFGSDTDEKNIFPATLQFLHEYKVHAAFFNILTPLHGTSLYDRMKAEGRLIDEANMERWPEISCHFRPMNFSPDELVMEVKKIHQDFYSTRSVLRRLPIPRSESRLATWNVNWTQMKVASNLDSMQEFSDF